jgi:hypothetical protein
MFQQEPPITFAANKQLLDWGAHQQQWQRPRINLAGYLPVAQPAAPNTEGIRAVMFRDEESRAYSTPLPNKGWGLEYYPIPDWMGK